MAHNLESPSGADPHWDALYRARGDEVMPHRPVFTGDVFADVPVVVGGETRTRTVMVIQHPCAMRTDGVNLVDPLLVSEVRKHKVLAPEDWQGYGKLMPLPDLLPDVDTARRHQAAMFDKLHLVAPAELTKRVACMSQRGVNLLLQRWVHHSSRVIVPTPDFQAVTSGVFEEADLVEEWCDERVSDTLSIEDATGECVSWLREDSATGGGMRQRMLEEPQNRSAVRKEMRAALRGV